MWFSKTLTKPEYSSNKVWWGGKNAPYVSTEQPGPEFFAIRENSESIPLPQSPWCGKTLR